MKKFIFVFSSIILALFLTILLFFKVYEDRLVRAFKIKIIDKTNINIDFEEIHFSILKYFPYGSFNLDDAKIFYSMHNKKDTLLHSKNLCFKINTINLFRSIYEFPEIIISDGSISIKSELLDTLFKSSNIESQNTSYLVETKNIKINRCKISYCYENSINLNIYTKESSLSGSFLPNSLSVELNLNVNHLVGRLNELRFKTNDFIKISSTIKELNHTYFSDNGKLSKGTIGIGFSFLYNTNNDYLQIKTTVEKISAKSFCKELLKGINIPLNKGSISFESFYSINFGVSKSQKLTLKYNLDNINIEGYKNLSILGLKGITTITNDFKQNHSDIERFLIHYNGFELIGSLKIKNFPHPSVLIDTKITNLGEMFLDDELNINGKINGKIKALVKIDNINKLDYRTLKINKLESELTLSNIAIKSIDYLNSISGTLKLNDDVLNFDGKGFLFNKEFKGNLVLPGFWNIAFQGAKPTPKIFIEMDRLNLDSVLMIKSNDSKNSINFELNARINSLKYKGLDVDNLEIKLINKDGKYNSDYFKLRAFKGQITGTFSYSNHHPNSLSIIGQGLDIQKLFNDFKNFGQTTITAKNISGSLSGKVDISYRILIDSKIDASSIKMVSNIIIENGKLSGLSQLKKLSGFLNISEIDSFRFKTIQNKIDIENGVIRIPSMDIASNALNFQISGKHGFDGEFKYWVKLNLKEILAKKFLSNKSYNSEYENDNKNGLNLFLNIYGNNESYKVGFDKKSSIDQFKSNLNREGFLIKSIIKEEFSRTKKKGLVLKDSASMKELNKIDSSHNKNQKKPFKIQWDELDSTKVHNQ